MRHFLLSTAIFLTAGSAFAGPFTITGASLTTGGVAVTLSGAASGVTIATKARSARRATGASTPRATARRAM